MEAPHVSEQRLGQLPIFPLADVQLFPNALFPLHVFEPRYVQLIEQVMVTDSVLAVATLKPGYEADYNGRPAVYPVMGAGVVIRANRLKGGRWNVIVRGTDRVRIAEELEAREEFREVGATRIYDGIIASDDPRARRLRGLLQALAGDAPQTAEVIGLLLGRADSAACLADLTAAHTIGDASLRRKLLESTDVGARLEACADYVGAMLLELHSVQGGTLH